MCDAKPRAHVNSGYIRLRSLCVCVCVSCWMICQQVDKMTTLGGYALQPLGQTDTGCFGVENGGWGRRRAGVEKAQDQQLDRRLTSFRVLVIQSTWIWSRTQWSLASQFAETIMRVLGVVGLLATWLTQGEAWWIFTSNDRAVYPQAGLSTVPALIWLYWPIVVVLLAYSCHNIYVVILDFVTTNMYQIEFTLKKNLGMKVEFRVRQSPDDEVIKDFS